MIWREVRSRAIAPVLSVAVALCMVMSFMLVFEAAYMSAVSLGVKLLRRKPEKMYKWEPIEGDEEKGSLAFPMVLVQIPMYNEREVRFAFIPNLPVFASSNEQTKYKKLNFPCCGAKPGFSIKKKRNNKNTFVLITMVLSLLAGNATSAI